MINKSFKKKITNIEKIINKINNLLNFQKSVTKIINKKKDLNIFHLKNLFKNNEVILLYYFHVAISHCM